MAKANVFDPAYDADMQEAGFVRHRARIGVQAGTSDLGATLHVLEPGQTAHPYHFHFGNEELMVLLSGSVSLRTPEGTEQLEPGDVVAHPVGERGAHQVTNRGAATARFLVVSEMNGPEVVVYPDSGKVAANEHPPGRSSRDGFSLVFRQDDAVDYFDGEAAPEE